MSSKKEGRMVDQSALKVNQAFIISLLLLAFVLSSNWLVVFVALVMLVGTAWPAAALFKQIYRRILMPRRIVKPQPIRDNPEPHRFAQGFGGVVLLLALATLFTGASWLGWALVWLVITLAALNLFVGFCAGCFVYYQLNRLGVPGFTQQPLTRGNRA